MCMSVYHLAIVQEDNVLMKGFVFRACFNGLLFSQGACKFMRLVYGVKRIWVKSWTGLLSSSELAHALAVC